MRNDGFLLLARVAEVSDTLPKLHLARELRDLLAREVYQPQVPGWLQLKKLASAQCLVHHVRSRIGAEDKRWKQLA